MRTPTSFVVDSGLSWLRSYQFHLKINTINVYIYVYIRFVCRGEATEGGSR